MDYKNGKIYKITNCIDDEVYIGSTTQTLTQRWWEHKSRTKNNDKNHYKIYQHMINLGIDKFSISLVENYPCTNKTELNCREGVLTRQLSTLHSRIEGRTDQEYYYDNKDKLLENKKLYFENNREHISDYKKEYYEKNKEKLIQKSHDNYQKRKEYLSEKVECDICKKVISRYHLIKHKKSVKCKNHVN